MSRSFRSLNFKRLHGTADEARTSARLLGDDCSLRLGAQARECELKAVRSPRVLHLATHGFFLGDQEFKPTSSLQELSLADTRSGRWSFVPPENRWENPMVRCGLALAGANHAQQVTNAIAEDGLLTGLEASLLNLQGTELVILSACDSGSGEVRILEQARLLESLLRQQSQWEQEKAQGVAALQSVREELRLKNQEILRLSEQLEEAQRAAHRQAAPFRRPEHQRSNHPGRSRREGGTCISTSRL